MRDTTMERHAHERYAHERYAHEMHAYERYIYERHAPTACGNQVVGIRFPL